ncbi:alpha/beta hydrolase [Spongiibacter sp. KMU-158]|uniref:Alpha/beta hydrolase n=1 Tax=Spongiibacter pelagi TaxID=2760804 RepID=A0A927C0K2_9GAMM|nr:alpha/beta hydrolase [Spongiibacter pelagi]MBD2857812.1 alpha/beta hydrolase [Spongiibacter pelagi]
MPWRELQPPPDLPALSLESSVTISPWVGEYLRYYGLDFEKDFAGLRHYLGYFDSVGERIACQVFKLPDAHCTAFVYHGYYDHVGLFNNVIEYCLRHGLSVVAYDLPGHGLSSGPRASIDDFLKYRQVLRDAFKAVDVFELPAQKIALAQSTGCAVLNSHVLDGGEQDFEKLVLMGPLVRPTSWWWGSPAHRVLKHFIKALPRKFAPNSSDNDFLEFLRERDPLQFRGLPLAWVGALKKWLPWFRALPSSNARVLIVQGDADDTVDWRYNVPLLQGKYPKAKLVMLPGGHHHLVKESLAQRAKLWQACDDFLFKLH